LKIVCSNTPGLKCADARARGTHSAAKYCYRAGGLCVRARARAATPARSLSKQPCGGRLRNDLPCDKPFDKVVETAGRGK